MSGEAATGFSLALLSSWPAGFGTSPDSQRADKGTAPIPSGPIPSAPIPRTNVSNGLKVQRIDCAPSTLRLSIGPREGPVLSLKLAAGARLEAGVGAEKLP